MPILSEHLKISYYYYVCYCACGYDNHDYKNMIVVILRNVNQSYHF